MFKHKALCRVTGGCLFLMPYNKYHRNIKPYGRELTEAKRVFSNIKNNKDSSAGKLSSLSLGIVIYDLQIIYFIWCTEPVLVFFTHVIFCKYLWYFMRSALLYIRSISYFSTFVYRFQHKSPENISTRIRNIRQIHKTVPIHQYLTAILHKQDRGDIWYMIFCYQFED